MLEILPSRNEFINSAKAGKIHPLYTEMSFVSPRKIFTSITPQHGVLLESIKGPEKIARYSFIGAEPFLTFKVKNGVTEIESDNRLISSLLSRDLGKTSPLKRLKNILASYKVIPPENLPPFVGGAVGVISYDFVHYLERLPKTATDDLNIPDAHFFFYDSVIAIDHKTNRIFIITCPAAEQIIAGSESSALEWNEFYDSACERINKFYEKIHSTSPLITYPRKGTINTKNITNNSFTGKRRSGRGGVKIHHEMGKDYYMKIVKRAKEYIRAGDIFQANLSQRVSAKIGGIRPWQIYEILSQINPSPFAAYLDMGDYHILSSSPERLVRVSENMVETRPIAGTRPRGVNADGDRLMRADLLLNEKERAEHLMLIDLERNDLGKISDYSTVEVDELMITEDYSHVIHIVSNIRGTMAKNRDCFDVIRATFPGGTITGVPKVRCMEIIDELEPVVRGPYTGSVGYISFTGSMDLNIIIRTFVIKDSTAYVQAGAGIVADSDPEKEYYETLKKAEALIKTLERL